MPLSSPDGRWTVRIGAEFEAAHNLRDYYGGPEPLHGHSYRVEVALETDGLGEFDLSVDFVPARKLVEELAARLHDRYVNEVPPFDRENPTAENIARWFAGEVTGADLRGSDRWRLREVTVWEGPKNRVTFEPAPGKDGR
jgi:6-pyruvoyltetrahydropterin/6-carboxytetrahydropterin synthase